MDNWIKDLLNSLADHIGQTVTIFTISGGLSGSGFTGVLISVDCNKVRLLSDLGAPPACPIGSNCSGLMTPFGIQNGYNPPFVGNPLGSVVVIPLNAIAAFTHNAI